jgi:thiamine biosynthesis protein ThiS
MMIFFNGKSKEVRDKIRLQDFIKDLNLGKRKLVILLNDEIEKGDRELLQNDRIDIISFIGGG